MVGTMEPVLDLLVEKELVKREDGRITLSPLARVMAEHFIGVERLFEIRDLAKEESDPLGIVAELACAETEKGRRGKRKKKRRGR